MGHAPQHVDVEDAGDVAVGADEAPLLHAVHPELGALQLSACYVALGGTVDANVEPSAALDADGVLLKQPSITLSP
jgi:hypothetical protein